MGAPTPTPESSPATDHPKARPISPRGLALGSVLLLTALFSLPWWGTPDQMRTLVEFITFLALAQMWNLLAGYGGMVSFGQQAWIGLGGYTLIVLADDLHVNMFLAVIVGGVVAALVALPTAALAFRLRGGYFAVGTWVIAEVFRLLVASSTEWLKGGLGRSLAAAGLMARPLREQYTYWLAIVIGAGAIALVYYLMRSRVGLGLTAIRDSESAAMSVGVKITRIKLLVFVIGAFGTGVVGGLIYLNALRITPQASFSIQWSAFMAFMVVIGGLGTVEGPIVGAVVFFVLRHYLSSLGPWSIILLGGTAVIIVLVAPDGLWGVLHRRFGLELFTIRRRLPAAMAQGQLAMVEGKPASRDPALGEPPS
ncbi:MAG TPA: branched-chain amino acid ABC transporter permease [Anaerolineae bacterium]|nr:branched-chain amino acid ABC transporter permease [Anaerolineae bacterium]